MPIFLSNNEFYMLMGGVAIGLIAIVLHILIALRTPAWTFFKAGMQKKPILFTVRRDQWAKFELVKDTKAGVLRLKNGYYNITEGSHHIEHKSKAIIFYGMSDVATTIPNWYPALIEDLKKKGYRIGNWGDYKKLVMFANKMLPFEAIKHIVATPEAKKSFRDDLKDGTIKIQPYKTLPLHNLTYMFPFNLNPSFIEARTQYEVQQNKSKENLIKVIMPLAIVLAIVIIAAAVAFQMISKGQPPQVHVNIPQAVSGGVEVIKQNVTQATSGGGGTSNVFGNLMNLTG